MNEFWVTLRSTFHRDQPARRPMITWLVSLAIFGLLLVIRRQALVNDQGFFSYVLGLYILDSLIFFVLFRQQPTIKWSGADAFLASNGADKIKIVMLTFIFLLEIAAIGYYVLAFASRA